MKQLLELVLILCEDLDSARALSIAILVRHGEWNEAQRLQPVCPSDFLDAYSYLKASCAHELVRKIQLDSERQRLHDAAVRVFEELERQNCNTNVRLSRFLPEKLLLEPGDTPIHEFFMKVRKEIGLLLGKLPSYLTPRFSGGATVGDKGQFTTIPDKMSGSAQIYPTSSDLQKFFWESSWGAVAMTNPPQVVRANTFFSVPKDGIKNRGCAKEASINVSLQLDIARVIRRRLRRWDIDLDRGQTMHKLYAKWGSRDDSLCTVDLSNASDTLAKNVVKLLLPEEWFSLLDSLRAHFSNVDGRSYLLEKFSSMGNGFTFELETLIFAGLARCLPGFCEEKSLVRVYGDDIVVSRNLGEDLLAVLRYVGFTPNTRKTFLTGPFRESCGGDYFEGHDVRAVNLKRVPVFPHEWIALANQLRRLRDKLAGEGWRAWRFAVRQVPLPARNCRGPESLGDLVIHDDPVSWRPRTRSRGGVVTVEYKTWHPVTKKLPWSNWRPEVVIACSTIADGAGVTPRSGVSGYRVRWIQDPPLGDQWLPQT